VEVYRYANGVIDERLPAPRRDVVLGPDWALQDPNDYIETFQADCSRGRRQGRHRSVPGNRHPASTSPRARCSRQTADGTPLCQLSEWRRNPHSWVKLWKHHAAQPEADDVNRVAAEMGEDWLRRYGGRISSEWFRSKAPPDPARKRRRYTTPPIDSSRPPTGSCGSSPARRRGTTARPATRPSGPLRKASPSVHSSRLFDPRFENLRRREDVAPDRSPGQEGGGV